MQYGLRGDGPVRWAAADRRLLELVQRRLGRYVMGELSSGRRTPHLILYAPQVVPGLWPWATRWRAVLLSTSTGGGSGGHRGHATALGCVMRVRSGQLGHPSDFDAAGEGDSMLALADVWQQGGDDGAVTLRRLRNALHSIMTAVASAGEPQSVETVSGAVMQALAVRRHTGPAAAVTHMPSVASAQQPRHSHRHRRRHRPVHTGVLPPPPPWVSSDTT